jgi:hypothetical protein
MTQTETMIEVVCNRVLDAVASHGAGHCIRIDDLPTSIADVSCERLQALIAKPSLVRLVVDKPTKEWHVTPSAAVTLRNLHEEHPEKAGVLVIFIPPDAQLSIEDSIGRSTFEVLSFADLGKRTAKAALARLRAADSNAADIAEQVVKVLARDSQIELSERTIASFYTAALSDNPAESVGRSLTTLGLLPDRELATQTDDNIQRRIQLNGQQMIVLIDTSDPVDRLRRLPIGGKGQRELVDALWGVIEDGESDRAVIADRLEEISSVVDYANWKLGSRTVAPEQFSIVSVLGMEGPLQDTIQKEESSVGIRFTCKPAPSRVLNARNLLLEVVALGRTTEDLIETGISFTKTALPKQESSQWKRRISVGDSESGLDSGPYRFRLSLISQDNTTIAETLSEVFYVGEDPTPVGRIRGHVLGIPDAKVKAVAAGLPPSESASFTCLSETDVKNNLFEVVVGFDEAGKTWSYATSHLLADYESQFLLDPSVRGYEIELADPGVDEHWLDASYALPAEFTQAREELFEAICRHQLVESDLPSSGLADLDAVSVYIEQYVRTWTECLKRSSGMARAALLGTDRVHITEGGQTTAVLIAPTHPLKLAWQVVVHNAVELWLTQASNMAVDDLEREAKELAAALDNVVPLVVPPVALDGSRAYRAMDTLGRGWGLYVSPSGADPRAVVSRVRSWFGLPAWRLGANGEMELLSRVRAYLGSHPYVRRLVVNVVRPGEAEFVLRLIGRLQADPALAHLKFVLRLFGDPSDASLGSTFDSFMSDPEGEGLQRDVADALTRSSEDPLVPKLAYSKHDISELADRPLDFPAHISVFLDYFDFEVVPVPESPEGQCLFGGGIVVEPVQRYDVGDSTRPPYWVNAVASTSGDGTFVSALRANLNSTAAAMGGIGIDPVPATRLELDTVAQALLDAVHRVSDWVVIIDPVFSDEFLDGASGGDKDPLYVLDMRAASGGGRSVVVSSRLRHEQSGLLAAVAERFGVDLPPGSAERLSRSLQVLGAGVGLRLLMDERRASEAFSLALATEHLRAAGLLRHGLLVPIDVHQELFREGQEAGVVTSLSRTDLAVVQLDPVSRRIGIHLVEVKVRSSLSADGDLPSELVTEMTEQLENTESVLLDRLFGLPLRRTARSLPAALQVQRLTVFLRHYLERSGRRGWIPEDELEELRSFVESLDRSFRVGVSLHGIVFHTKGTGERIEDRGRLRTSVLGSEYIESLLTHHAELETKVAGQNADEYAKTVFGAPANWIDIDSDEAPRFGEKEPETPIMLRVETSDEDAGGAAEAPETDSAPRLEDVELLGVTEKPRQFGIIGSLPSSGREVAIDLGPNVVSVFGVQGSGKSYTVGTIIEAALLPARGLHRLDIPLGVAVFHYSDSPSYLPEFTSMMNPSREGRSEELRERLGLLPQGVGNIVVVVPPRVLQVRKSEFPDHQVEPLLFGPDELQLADWKLLMGIEGGNQMYARAMALVLRGFKENELTLTRLREAVEHSDLNKSQKNFAAQRLDFVAPYVQEGAKVGDLMQSGRLVVVDMRDELIDKAEALALFMVLLNRFTESKRSKTEFNKLIVFDEAHKYMSESNLTSLITETVREMRHRGTSIVIASQDPPSVPQEIVELSTVIFAHKFTSPAWLRHLQRVSVAFAGIRGSQLTDLDPGSAYVWARGNSRFDRPQRVVVRARLTQHGGETRLA